MHHRRMVAETGVVQVAIILVHITCSRSRPHCPRLELSPTCCPMTSLAIPITILSLVDSSVSAIYDRHRYDAEARVWLQKWADYLDALTVGNVVPLRAA